MTTTTATQNNYSPLLHPHVGTQQNPGAAAFFNNQLYYIGNGQQPTIWVLSRSLDSLNPNEAPDKGQTFWSQTQLGQLGPDVPFRTEAQPACAVIDDLYFVWIMAGGVFATRLPAAEGDGSAAAASGNSSSEWSAPVVLCDTSGTHLHSPLSNVSVTAWGDYLIACYRGESEVSLLVYDTYDWPSESDPSSWKACGAWSNDFTDWPNFPAYADLGKQISMGCFTPGATKPGGGSAAPAIYLIISFFNEETHDAYVLHAMDLTPLDQWTGARPFKQWQVEQWKDVTRGVNVIRDPAGRMRAYHGDEIHDIKVRTLATNVVSADGYSWSKFGAAEYLYTTEKPPQPPPQPADQAPVPAFVMKNPSNNGNQGNGNQGNGNTTEAWEFVLFKHDGIKLCFREYGETVSQSQSFDLNQPQTSVQVVTGIVDSPLPVPKANLAGSSSTEVEGKGTSSSSPKGSWVQYGTTKKSVESHSTNWSSSTGFISEGYASAGVTPAWQIAYNAGSSGMAGQVVTSQTSEARYAKTPADLQPLGNYFYAWIEFIFQEYYFNDLPCRGTTYSKATNAPIMTSNTINYEGIQPGQLRPYANTTGNLWSYTKAAWNKRMQQLGYSGDNYFDEMITANAVSFGTTNSNLPYLTCGWTSTGEAAEAYQNWIETFEEAGWHMELKFYVGYSFQAGAQAFGVGEEQFAEFLAGISYSRTTETEAKDGTGWGVKIQYEPTAPSAPYYPGQVTKVTFNTYLLKANKHWTKELIEYGDPIFKDQIDPNSAPWRIVFELEEGDVVFQGDNRNLVYRDQSGQIIEAWWYPGTQFSYGSALGTGSGTWGWTNLTQEAVAFDPSAAALPNAVSEPFWFAWGMSQPGYTLYKQAVVFRAANGDIYFLWSESYDGGVKTPTNTWPNIVWTWRNLGETENFVQAAGDPVGFYWETNPWPRGPSISVIYRGVDGDLHELSVWAEQMDGAWTAVNVTGSLPAAEKPASDPCALVWNEDPGGSSEHIYYRAHNNQIYEMYYDRDTPGWTQTAVSALSHAQATPTGKPAAFVWSGGGAPSLRVGYRGSEGEIHELLRQGNNWQPVIDPSSVAGATAADRLAGEGPICGIAWEQRAALQTIHWYYLNSSGDVCELFRYAGDAAKWRWNNLSEKATATKQGSGKLPAVAAIVQGQVWYFDPENGSSIDLYLRAQDGALYELRYLPTEPGSQTGVWQWTELTGWVANAHGNLLPKAASG